MRCVDFSASYNEPRFIEKSFRNREDTTLYSYLSASIGSNRAAFIAGHMPKIKPIPTETFMPAIGA
jgi:hypothetical protein